MLVIQRLSASLHPKKLKQLSFASWWKIPPKIGTIRSFRSCEMSHAFITIHDRNGPLSNLGRWLFMPYWRSTKHWKTKCAMTNWTLWLAKWLGKVAFISFAVLFAVWLWSASRNLSKLSLGRELPTTQVNQACQKKPAERGDWRKLEIEIPKGTLEKRTNSRAQLLGQRQCHLDCQP